MHQIKLNTSFVYAYLHLSNQDQHNVGPSSPPLPFVATCSVQPALHSTVGGTGDGDVPAPPQAPPLTALSKSFQSTSKDIQFGDQVGLVLNSQTVNFN